MSADLIYQELKGSIKAKPGLQTLERVKEACDALINDHVKPTVVSVGQYCELHYGKPKEASIRNVAYLTDYIKLRTSEQTLSNEVQEDIKSKSDV